MQNDLARVRVREYGPADLEDCMQIFETNVPRFFTDEEREEYRQFLGTPLPGPYLVLEDDANRMVGCGGYAITSREGRADMCWGMVRQDMHGRGLGKLLTRARLERAIADPAVRYVALHTSQHTRGFYEALGFRTLGVTPDGYGAGLDRCDMRMDVDSA